MLGFDAIAALPISALPEVATATPIAPGGFPSGGRASSRPRPLRAPPAPGFEVDALVLALLLEAADEPA